MLLDIPAFDSNGSTSGVVQGASVTAFHRRPGSETDESLGGYRVIVRFV